VSAEFLFVLSALALLFLIIYTVNLGQKTNLFQAQDTLAGMRNAYAMSAALNYIHLAGDGAQYNFTLSGVSQRENITLSGAAVQSNRTYAISHAPLLNGNVNTSSIEGGRMIIKNKNGAIEIE
jgi:hypothetical protein